MHKPVPLYLPRTVFAAAMALAIAAVTLPAANAAGLEIITLKHRPADQLIPIIEPLVEAGGTITGRDNKLFIKTSDENLADLQRIVAELDTRLRVLRISVRQDRSNRTLRDEQGLSARVRDGDVAARLPDTGTRSGASVTWRDDDGRVRYRNLSTRDATDSYADQFVRAVEGQPAFIAIGQSVPLANRGFAGNPYYGGWVDSIEYRDVGTGFYVTPRLNGDAVNVAISPYTEKLRPGGRIDFSQTDAVVSGRLGEWLPLSGTTRTSRDAGTANLTSTRHKASDNFQVWIRVDEVR
ncbi:MAG: hypothetical protein HKO62_00530 [Gammaproteobacteria bacterium]|nr:hypothetical protein [Gammaproteobacteria bacterium]NNL99201.1 hypothetical protein [Gammaproteobacteria bacterium]